MPQLRISHTITQTRRMRHLRKEQIMDPLDEIIRRIDEINAQVKSIMALLRIEHIVQETPSDAESANPDAG